MSRKGNCLDNAMMEYFFRGAYQGGGGINQQETVAGLSGHSLLTLFPLCAMCGAEGGVSQWSFVSWRA